MSIIEEIKHDAEERYKKAVEEGDIIGVYCSQRLIIGLEQQKFVIEMLNKLGAKNE